MVRILANDGISDDGILLLEEAGYVIDVKKIPQEELIEVLPDYDAVIIRSATKLRKEVLAECPNLKLIVRAGVALDNVDVDFAQSKGIKVINTSKSSAQSVAELVFGHLFTLARHLHLSNRRMPGEGQTDFNALKNTYSKGIELRGKTLGILGFGNVGQAVARMALGLGMNIMPVDLVKNGATIDINIFNVDTVAFSIKIETYSLAEMLKKSDFITLHVPYSSGKAIISTKEFAQMKNGVFIIDAAQAGVMDENALLEALNSGKVGGAGIDVFMNEPQPNQNLLDHDKVSVSPHIGGSTIESRAKINFELADRIIEFFGE